MEHIKAKSFVTIMVIIAASVLFLRVAVEGVIKMRISQNESDAQAALKSISAALENYAKSNSGAFPSSLAVLTQGSPPYLDRDYISESRVKGYDYSCKTLDSSGYSCSAAAAKCGLSGKKNFTVNTGGSFSFEECAKSE